MAKYGKKAGEKVERAMRERKRGTLKSGGQAARDEPQAGDCHRPLGSAQSGAKVPKRSSSRKDRARADARPRRRNVESVTFVAPVRHLGFSHLRPDRCRTGTPSGFRRAATATTSTGSRGVRRKAAATCSSGGAPTASSLTSRRGSQRPHARCTSTVVGLRRSTVALSITRTSRTSESTARRMESESSSTSS
jgi:hypothetical protein